MQRRISLKEQSTAVKRSLAQRQGSKMGYDSDGETPICAQVHKFGDCNNGHGQVAYPAQLKLAARPLS
jgi:hypothetical protein